MELVLGLLRIIASGLGFVLVACLIPASLAVVLLPFWGLLHAMRNGGRYRQQRTVAVESISAWLSQAAPTASQIGKTSHDDLGRELQPRSRGRRRHRHGGDRSANDEWAVPDGHAIALILRAPDLPGGPSTAGGHPG